MAIVEVIQYNGNPDVFAWKYPNNELGTWTQLIVNESQEAILMLNGQALDSFGPGTHSLHPDKIPLFSRFSFLSSLFLENNLRYNFIILIPPY